jgi:uncharacterized protein (TIGR03084 family)
MLQQAVDLREEADALHSLLERLDDGDWARSTRFKAWTVNDIVQHLHDSDLLAAASLRDPEEYGRLRAAIMAKRDAGMSRLEETRERLGHLTGRRLLERWKDTIDALCAALEARNPDDRVKWSGPDMGVRMFATARQMEVWAHGQAVYDLKGVARANTDRIKNIAVLGVRTFGWTFANRGEQAPDVKPFVRLTAPSGAVWEWNDSGATASVEGDAVEFCQVVTQVRNIADTRLAVSGDAAKRWMRIAQCFAGPAENPPAPGTRFMAR